MILRPLVPPQLAKEVRALLPAWAASVCVVAASAVIDDSRLVGLAVLAYGLGSIALGAQAMGHEYSSRTLGVLLAQPFDRRRILLVKVVVLASMIATLTLLAWAVLMRREEILRPDIWRSTSTLLLAAPLGLFVAPFLTMLCRGPLAGMVFTVAAPGLLLIFGDLIGLQRYGSGGGALIDEFKIKVLWWGTLAGSAIAALASWQMFMRLEAIDGRGADLSLPDWRHLGGHAEETQPETAVRVRHPAWLLVNKELHLQQMTFVVASLYILSWIGVSLLRTSVPDFPELPLAPLSLLYSVLLAGLIGSLASAEERQLGTIEWQMLLPMPAWQQWSIKVGTVLALVLVLGIGLPVGLWYLSPSAAEFRIPVRAWREMTVVLVWLTTSSLYVSSLCGSGVKAAVLNLPALFGTVMFVRAAIALAYEMPYPAIVPKIYVSSQTWATIMTSAALTLTIAIAALVLRFAFGNHRSAERAPRRISRQVAWVGSTLAAGVLIMSWIERALDFR
jgi:hypothetical protein